MSDKIVLRRVMKLKTVDTGIFSVLQVFPENIISLLPISEKITEITIKSCDGTTNIKVSHSEKEIKDLIKECLRQDGMADANHSL